MWALPVLASSRGRYTPSKPVTGALHRASSLLGNRRRFILLPLSARAAKRLSATTGTGMTKSRLEAFSDGVIAVIITIMVLEMKVPHGAELSAVTPLVPVFLTYILSFIFVGIYWT